MAFGFAFPIEPQGAGGGGMEGGGGKAMDVESSATGGCVEAT